MKTKHILTALALPAMFAACTAEDIVSENNALQQGERAKLSKNFVLNINNGVESRYAVEGATGLDFIFEEGDLVGANLIDKYEPTKADPADWTIVPYVAPSLPFKFNGADEWKSDAELGIGNYLFTYPFNAKDNGRAAAQFELPRIQEYNGEDLNKIIEDNNKAVGAVVLYEGQTTANVSLKNLYTYPKLVLNFDNGEKITKVSKIILKYTNKVIYKGGFNHDAISKMFDEEEIEKWLKANKGKSEEDYWASKGTNEFIINEGEVDRAGVELTAYGKPLTSDYLIVEMGENVELESNTSNKYVEVRLMMPSVDVFNNNTGIKLYAVTDNGTYVTDLDEDACSFKSTTSAEKIAGALGRSKANTLNLRSLTLDKNNTLGNIVTTVEDWNNLVSVYGDSKKFDGTTQTLKVSVLSDEFALTSELDMPEVAVFEIATPISVEGEVELNNIKATDVVTVKKGGVLTTSATFTATTVRVEEGAELVFAAKLNDKDEVVEYTGVAAIMNYGKVTVPAGVIAKVNLASMWNEPNFKNACNGKLYVGAAASRAAAEAVANLTGQNFGEIYNYGVINATSFFNDQPLTNFGYETDEETGEWTDMPTIYNYGKFNVPTGTVANGGLFVNEGVLTSNIKNGKFNNFLTSAQGTIDVKAGSTTYIDDNTGAVIVVAELKPALTIFDAKEADKYSNAKRGTIKYTVSGKAAKVDLTGSPVNYLVAEAGIELSKSYNYVPEGKTAATYVALPTLEMVDGGSLKITANPATGSKTAQVTTLNILAGEAVVSGHINSVGTIKIAKDASLTIPAGEKLTIAKYTSITEYATDNKGTVQVNGTLVVTDATGDEDGNISASTAERNNSMLSVGKEGKVTGKEDTSGDPTADEIALANATTKALTGLVNAWIENASTIGSATGNISSWETLVGENANPVTYVAAPQWDTNTKGWVVEAKNAFYEVFEDAEIEYEETIAATLAAEDDQVKEILTAIKNAVNLKEALVPATGTWFGNAVYMKTASDQVAKKIADASGNTMYAAWEVYFEDMTQSALGNAAWLTWNDTMNAVDSEGDSAYPANIYSLIADASYVELYEGSEICEAVALWVSLSNKYGDTITTGKFTSTNVGGVEEMAAFFNAIYKENQNGVILKGDVFFTQDTEDVTAEFVKKVAAWGYTDSQIAKVVEFVGEAYDLDVTAPTTGKN